ncbi:uncharacterized protein CC84DRAFT_491827 [Paraphaeosphaeria sporulosa]|uniref:Uncharacterized protein n=1 Tax=Paraphaeosphaeria sporulosa TaxID=1460663 RepID=A0A177CTT7_9PLEO|nr:uncharacterized protein CC84DRAFT_491827 [Paraphaeosphaeria sporulosa]OAG10686.1 hypothetical protein CC84DRAFT_491827 [Paraphaeosphaeria sporulosa]
MNPRLRLDRARRPHRGQTSPQRCGEGEPRRCTTLHLVFATMPDTVGAGGRRRMAGPRCESLDAQAGKGTRIGTSARRRAAILHVDHRFCREPRPAIHCAGAAAALIRRALACLWRRPMAQRAPAAHSLAAPGGLNIPSAHTICPKGTREALRAMSRAPSFCPHRSVPAPCAAPLPERCCSVPVTNPLHSRASCLRPHRRPASISRSTSLRRAPPWPLSPVNHGRAPWTLRPPPANHLVSC